MPVEGELSQSVFTRVAEDKTNNLRRVDLLDTQRTLCALDTQVFGSRVFAPTKDSADQKVKLFFGRQNLQDFLQSEVPTQAASHNLEHRADMQKQSCAQNCSKQ